MTFGFGNTNTDNLYADEDGLCGWETSEEEDITLSNAGKIGNSWGNRNALHVDVTGIVAENENLVWRIFNSFAGIRDDDSHMKGKGFGGLADLDGLREPVSMIEYPGITESDDGILTKNNIYSPGNGIKGVEFVRLNDEAEYIFEARRAIFDEIKRFLIHGGDFEYKDLLLGDEKYKELLRSQGKNIDHLLFNGYITREEIVEIIENFFEMQSEIIAGYLLYGQTDLETITPKDKEILVWGVSNVSFVKDILPRPIRNQIGNNVEGSDDGKLLKEYLTKLGIE